MKKTILVGVSGGIAAHRKVVGLFPTFKEAGYAIEVILTENALRMVKLEELRRVSDTVHTELFSPDFNFESARINHEAKHIDIARRADLFLIVPATANTIAKLAHGIADNLLTTVALAVKAPILFCPSMNESMWLNPATQDNVATLEKRGFVRIGPRKGPFVSQVPAVGNGCVADNDAILKIVQKTLEITRAHNA
jgi:phosphopantothenoylcysteine synthetase/decarboxylase